jgi:hypothetical protein
VTNGKETTNYRKLTWTTEGTITVNPESKLTVNLQITEKESEYIFKTKVALKGMVVVKILKALTISLGAASVSPTLRPHLNPVVKEALQVAAVSLSAFSECTCGFLLLFSKTDSKMICVTYLDFSDGFLSTYFCSVFFLAIISIHPASSVSDLSTVLGSLSSISSE